MKTVNKERLVTALLLPAVIPLVLDWPALGGLLALAVVMVALAGYETAVYATARDRARRADSHPQG